MPLLVRRFERLGDLSRNRQRLVERNRPACDPLRQILAFNEFKDQRFHAIGVFDPVNVCDVRMVQRREHLRFSAEPREAVGIVGDSWQQHLDCDVSIQLGVARAIHLAHPACAERGQDFVRTKM